MRISNVNINPPIGEDLTIQVGLIDAKNQSIFVHVEIPAHALQDTTIGHLRKLALEKAVTVVAEAKHDH